MKAKVARLQQAQHHTIVVLSGGNEGLLFFAATLPVYVIYHTHMLPLP